VSDIAMWSVERLHAAYASGQLSPVELVEAQLERIERWDPLVHAFISVDADGARRRAQEAERELRQGTARIEGLFGVTMAVKDVIPVAGLRFTEGAERYTDRIADVDAITVSRSRSAGAIIIGKTNTPEYASYVNTRSAIAGTTLSPWNLAMSSGGSSGGSAVAVALGMATVALGTDHGGSVRIPAGINGIMGIRSTPGLVPVWPSPWAHDPFDVHGPLARHVDDLDIVLAIMSGRDLRAPLSGAVHVRGRYREDRFVDELAAARVGHTVDFDGTLLVDSSIRRAFAEAVEVLGGFVATTREHAPDLLEGVDAIPKLRQFRGLIEHRDRMSDLDGFFNPMIRVLLENAQKLAVQDVAGAFVARSNMALKGVAYFDDHDLFVLPTTQFPSFEADSVGPIAVDEGTFPDPLSSSLVTYLLSVVGWPSVTVPCGLASNGIPVGLQIAGPRGSEYRILAAAARYAQEAPFRHELPSEFQDA